MKQTPNNTVNTDAQKWWNGLTPVRKTILCRFYFAQFTTRHSIKDSEIEYIYNLEHLSPTVNKEAEEGNNFYGFTQGNWEVFIQPSNEGSVRTINVGAKRIATLSFLETIEESEANAKLISSAPAMYQCLKQLRKWFDEHGKDYGIGLPNGFVKAKAIINSIR